MKATIEGYPVGIGLGFRALRAASDELFYAHVHGTGDRGNYRVELDGEAWAALMADEAFLRVVDFDRNVALVGALGRACCCLFYLASEPARRNEGSEAP